jgi:hypothetical protein
MRPLNKLDIVEAAQDKGAWRTVPCAVREAANILFAVQRGVIRPHRNGSI